MYPIPSHSNDELQAKDHQKPLYISLSIPRPILHHKARSAKSTFPLSHKNQLQKRQDHADDSKADRAVLLAFVTKILQGPNQLCKLKMAEIKISTNLEASYNEIQGIFAAWASASWLTQMDQVGMAKALISFCLSFSRSLSDCLVGESTFDPHARSITRAPGPCRRRWNQLYYLPRFRCRVEMMDGLDSFLESCKMRFSFLNDSSKGLRNMNISFTFDPEDNVEDVGLFIVPAQWS